MAPDRQEQQQQQHYYAGGKGLKSVLIFLPCAAILLATRIYGKLELSGRFIVDERIVVDQTLERMNDLQQKIYFNSTTPMKNGTHQNIFSLIKMQTPGNNSNDDDNTASSLSNNKTLLQLATFQKPLTLIVRMSGEMGNHLSKLAYGYSLKWLLQEEYNISTEILLQHQDNGKWKQCVKNIQTCFVNTRSWSFDGVANAEEFHQRKRQQHELFGETNRTHFEFECQEEDCILEKVQNVVQSLQHYQEDDRIDENVNYNITLPYIFSDGFASFSYWNNRYPDRIKQLLGFDLTNPKCCNQTAAPDESVMHIRGFLKEMPRKGKKYGFEELSPHKIAHELFAHLPTGEKVVLLSRVPDENYTKALLSRGLQARYVTGQNPMQDFCFLMSAQKDMVGYAMSTYAVYAAYLGNASKARLYSLKSPERLERMGTTGYYQSIKFTNPILRDRVVFEEYNSEAQDEVEQNETIQ